MFLWIKHYRRAPVDYILVSNHSAALPAYIVQYSYATRTLQIRLQIGKYCSFHNEYHKCGAQCDGHHRQDFLGRKTSDSDKSGDVDTSDWHYFDEITGPWPPYGGLDKNTRDR